MTQNFHSDGDHLTRSKHAPPYGLNVFIPLVDLDVLNGPTELCPGTHVLGHFDDSVQSILPCIPAGQTLLFDFRLRHRGMGNNSTAARPVVYLTYATPRWKDNENFNRRRYRKLPELVTVVSREDRVRNRNSTREDS